MSDIAIRVDGLSKMYRIGAARGGMEGPPGLRHVLEKGFKGLFSRLRGQQDSSRKSDKEFWALQDVSFEVKKGECIGVIGRNGAGKSTLLKILSRITEPTKGEIRLRGRVGSLLEVGTGFHPELTGRENIFLNGSVLGMSRQEVKAKFDEIVAFSEVDQFLDTPVKRYSSGMYVRLAFAVAAHLEPEILIVDEVLAVGDAAFQKKCLGRMSEVAGHGRTVLFVSHNMAAIRSLCQSAVVLNRGRVAYTGSIGEGVAYYMGAANPDGLSSARRFQKESSQAPCMKFAEIRSEGKAADHVDMGDSLILRVEFTSPTPLKSPRLGFVISDADGRALLNANNRYQLAEDPESPLTHGSITCILGKIPFMPGRYHVSLWFGGQAEDTHVEHEALSFEVESCDVWGTSQSPPKVSPFWWPVRFLTSNQHQQPEVTSV